MLFVNSLYEVSSCYVSLYNNLQVCTSLFQSISWYFFYNLFSYANLCVYIGCCFRMYIYTLYMYGRR
jgi:hypothetical protein